MQFKYIDLTHTFTNNMPFYPGDTKPEIVQTVSFKEHGFNCFKINTGFHVGTHMDAPLHMLENGKKLSEFAPDRFFGKGHLIDARERPISAELLESKNISAGDIILIMTGFDKYFYQDIYYKSFPKMTENFARKLAELKVGIVGMDTPSPDDYPFSLHRILMSKDILIIENLTNLQSLENCEDFTVIALPAKYEAEAAPVRVIAQIR